MPRAELWAAILAARAKPFGGTLQLRSDAAYVVRGLEAGSIAETLCTGRNGDLWFTLAEITRQRLLRIQPAKVKSHAEKQVLRGLISVEDYIGNACSIIHNQEPLEEQDRWVQIMIDKDLYRPGESEEEADEPPAEPEQGAAADPPPPPPYETVMADPPTTGKCHCCGGPICEHWCATCCEEWYAYNFPGVDSDELDNLKKDNALLKKKLAAAEITQLKKENAELKETLADVTAERDSYEVSLTEADDKIAELGGDLSD